MTTVHVGGPSPYDVVVDPGAQAHAPDFVADARTVAVVCNERVQQLAVGVVKALESAGARVATLLVRPGEAAKGLDTVAGLWKEFADIGLTRSDLVVAVGGGATTDVAGFAAATWLRGVRVVHVPTTLLGMVDAAVGGKTGINTDAGKNLVGAFHPPAGVLVDLDVLDQLPAAEWVNGMAEVVKAGFIADPVILDLIEQDPAAAARPDCAHRRELVERSIRVKADVVAADLREAGPREMLNYGHTLGHAIERVEEFRLPHGQAVSVGLVFAAGLGRHAGGLDAATADRHRTVLDALGLPTTYRGQAWPELHDAMRVDKKSRGGRLRFVVLEALARPAILESPDLAVLEAAFAEVAG
jgi:3-dehydroquinate synthase